MCYSFAMALSRDQVRHIALLARLALTEEEEQTFAEQLGEILQAFDKLAALDTSDVEPTSHVVEVADAYRDDIVTNPAAVAELLANAPSVDGTHFRVPKIIE